MKTRGLVLGFAALLCAFPLLAQSIPAGDDPWDSLGGGASDLTLSSADWAALCGARVPDTAVQLKGFNLPGQGTADVVVTREGDADLAVGESVLVPVRLKDLSFVNDGAHPCSPLTIRITEASSQQSGTMTITRDSAGGGTFTAEVSVSAVVQAVNGAGTVVGSTAVNGVLGDESPSPWSYQPPMGSSQLGAWYPGVDPTTRQPVRVCRRGNKILPARHCYQRPPRCPKPQPLPVGTNAADDSDDVIQDVEQCTVEADSDTL